MADCTNCVHFITCKFNANTCKHYWEKKRKMTTKEAIHILMHMDRYVEYDEDFGMMVRAPLMDACNMAIRALKDKEE